MIMIKKYGYSILLDVIPIIGSVIALFILIINIKTQFYDLKNIDTSPLSLLIAVCLLISAVHMMKYRMNKKKIYIFIAISWFSTFLINTAHLIIILMFKQ